MKSALPLDWPQARLLRRPLRLSPLNSAPLPKPPRFVMGHVSVDRMPIDHAVAWVVHRLKHRESLSPLLIVGPNAQLVTLAACDRQFAEALQAADLSVPDGISVVLASRLLRQPIPERVTGGDLMERLCAEAARYGFSVFFLGGLPGAAAAAAASLRRRYPALRIAGTYCPPRGFERDSMESAHIRQLITDAAPDLLCVAFGAPKQEIWMHENCPSLPIGAAIAVGAALDTQAGLRTRAPQWTHALGMEWLYRLIREPKRLWRRYLFGNTQFLLLVLRQWLAGTTRFSEPAMNSATFTDSVDSLGA
jgi:N-acetylglucosaminyldiphosphoundecaprenol N-acetyl-beta-D-mannosaminyltransferase